MSERMDGLLDEANHQVEQLEALARHFEAMQARLASTPALRPTKGWLTSRFGMRKDPMTGRNTMHRGIDFAASIGTPIVSPADGAVIKVEEQTGYGLVVMVDHGFGMMTKYAHLADAAVRWRHSASRDRIGSVGMSGRSTGPHLHYEVLVDGVAADPEYFILDWLNESRAFGVSCSSRSGVMDGEAVRREGFGGALGSRDQEAPAGDYTDQSA